MLRKASVIRQLHTATSEGVFLWNSENCQGVICGKFDADFFFCGMVNCGMKVCGMSLK